MDWKAATVPPALSPLEALVVVFAFVVVKPALSPLEAVVAVVTVVVLLFCCCFC